jgi:peptide/nickel transport system permease protein
MLGLLLLTIIFAAVLLAPLLTTYSPDDMNLAALNLLPSRTHPFGTDFLGRDLLSRTLYGGRLSIAVGVGVVLIESLFGISLGLVAGYAGKLTDALIMRLGEVLLAIPGLILAMGIIAFLGTGTNSVVVALGIGGIPVYARLSRAITLKTREAEYVQAARAMGCSSFFILRRHVLPNALDPLVVLFTTNFGGAVLASSALSYLGIGTQSPQADWGTLLQTGYDHMFQTWSGIVLPGIAVSLTTLGSALLGDGLTDARNPRQ